MYNCGVKLHVVPCDLLHLLVSISGYCMLIFVNVYIYVHIVLHSLLAETIFNKHTNKLDHIEFFSCNCLMYMLEYSLFSSLFSSISATSRKKVVTVQSLRFTIS